MSELAPEKETISHTMSPAICPLCSKNSRIYIDPQLLVQGLASTRFKLQYCEACDFAFIDPIPQTEDLNQFYSQDYYGEDNDRFVGPIEAVSLWARRNRFPWKKYFKQPGKALDIGCGRGEFLEELKARGWKVFGTEVNETAAVKAKKILGESVFVGDVWHAGHESGSFDLISFYHVIEHVSEPVRMLDEISRILKPGGILLLATPNFASWGMKRFREKAFALGITQNNYYFSPKAIFQLLNNRFEVLGESYFSWEQDPFSYAQTFLNALDQNDNFLFKTLYRKKPENFSWPRYLKTLLLCLAAVPLGFLTAVFTAWRKQGYSMAFILRKK